MPLYRLILYASPLTCPAKDTGMHTRAGQFQDMLGNRAGQKKREEAIHPPNHKVPWEDNGESFSLINF